MVNVAFRVDASRQIGSGHVMRCLALAEALKDKGAQVCFLSRTEPGDLNDWVAARGVPVTALHVGGANDERADAAATVAALSEAVDWLVVDSYALGAAWQDAVRTKAKRIMVIDDLANRPHHCDLLLDQNFHVDAAGRYRGLLPASCRGFFGPRYALLTRQFAEERSRLRPRGDEVRRLLVFFGGADSGGATGRTLDALEILELRDIAVDVVVGAANPRAAELERRCRAAGWAFYRQTETMPALMAAADLAIGAGGVATWERCCLGLPSLAWAVADNQRPGLAQLAARDAVDSPAASSVSTAEGIRHHLYALLHNPARRQRLGAASLAVCDGLGARRVAAAMLRGAIAMRPAAASDGEAMLRWRNHPAIRRYSTDARPIAADAHRAWFEQSLRAADRLLLIGEVAGGEPVGVVRYDLSGDNSAQVSIYLLPERLGEGWGAELLAAGEAWLRAARPAITRLSAAVLRENAASVRLFAEAGFVEQCAFFGKELTS